MQPSNNSFILRAPAKINLYLHVTGQRADGYHLLDSLVVFADDVADELEFSSAENFSLTVDGPFKDVVPEQNLVSDAVHLMEKATGKTANIHIHLTKNIPAGAGLGGGSSDAAATVRGLEKFWGITLDKKTRDGILLKLGADVPVCYHGKPCRFKGIGDVIESAPPIPPLFMVIMCPNVHSATKDVFRARTGGFGKEAEPFSDYMNLIKHTRNDLQDAAEKLCPSIGEAREYLKNQSPCFLARMSGSGSAVFGLFENIEDAQKTALQTQKSYPAWFVRSCQI